MKLHCIKLLAFISLSALFLTGCAVETFAGVGTVTGYVKTKNTQAPVADIWIEWKSPIRMPSNEGIEHFDQDPRFPRDGEYGTRYAKTDSSGKFTFVHQVAPEYFSGKSGSDNGYSFINIDARAKQFLTWIKPNEPGIPPDTMAVDIYKSKISDYENKLRGSNNDHEWAANELSPAIKAAQSYRPQGEGWVRINNRTGINGGFQCNAPPTFTAIKPTAFNGFFDNNGKNIGDWGNGYTPIVYPGVIELVSTSPVGFHDGDGINSQTPSQGNLNSCSVFGWTKKMDSDQKLDVQVYIGGPVGAGIPSIKTKADKTREDSLSGFGFDIKLPAQYQDGVKKDIYVYAVDTDGSLTPLAQTPRSLVCGASTTTPTPQPTPKPVLSPKVDIWAESGSQVSGRGTPGGTLKINVDQPTTIAWTAQNSSSCVGSGNWAGVKQAGASRLSQQLSKVSPGLTYNYTLTCFNNESGEQESDTVIVSVNPGTERPFIQTEEGDVHSNEGINIPQ